MLKLGLWLKSQVQQLCLSRWKLRDFYKHDFSTLCRADLQHSRHPPTSSASRSTKAWQALCQLQQQVVLEIEAFSVFLLSHIHIYIYIYTHTVFMYTYTHACTRTRTRAHTHRHRDRERERETHTHTERDPHAHTHTHTHTHTHIHTERHTNTRRHTKTHTHTRATTQTQTQTQTETQTETQTLTQTLTHTHTHFYAACFWARCLKTHPRSLFVRRCCGVLIPSCAGVLKLGLLFLKVPAGARLL